MSQITITAEQAKAIGAIAQGVGTVTIDVSYPTGNGDEPHAVVTVAQSAEAFDVFEVTFDGVTRGNVVAAAQFRAAVDAAKAAYITSGYTVEDFVAKVAAQAKAEKQDEAMRAIYGSKS